MDGIAAKRQRWRGLKAAPVPRDAGGTGAASKSTETRSRLGPDHVPALPQLVLADLAAGVPLGEGPLG